MNRYVWILMMPWLLASSARGAESVTLFSYYPFNHHLGEGESLYPGVCIVPQPIQTCSAAGRAAVSEINAPLGGITKYCSDRRIEPDSADQYNPLRYFGLQVTLKDEISDADYPGYSYRRKPYTVEVNVTSTSKLLMMDSRDLSNQGYPSADALVAAGFYCALLATGPETSNVVTLRVALPKASVPLLGNWREIKVHWDEKRQTVREGSIMGYVLHRSLGVWYCCTEEEAKEARERDAGQ